MTAITASPKRRTLTGQPSSQYVRESPITMIEGESAPFTLTIPGDSPAVSGPSQAVYNAETDVSSTCLSGSTSATGAVVTTKTVGTLKGGETYILTMTQTVDGRVDIYLLEIRVLFPYGASS